jgi:hypothetical protein
MPTVDKQNLENTTEQNDNVPTSSKKERWGEQDDIAIKTKQISENNHKYGEWWCTNLSRKASSVVQIVKHHTEMSTGKKIWAKNSVRVKLYNSLNSLMEEHSLYDVLIAQIRNNKDNPFPNIEHDSKNQVNNLGTYFISYDIYSFLQKKWDETDKTVNEPNVA